MDNIIENFDPQAVWKHFSALYATASRSLNEDKLAEYIGGFARANNLNYKIDGAGNIVVSKPAAKGWENRKRVLLYSPVGLFCRSAGGSAEYSGKSPSAPFIEDGWVVSSGAGGVVGMAAALAALESRELEHGPLDVLFTNGRRPCVVGNSGAGEDFIDADIALNLGADTEGKLYVGNAGMVELRARFKYAEDRNLYRMRKALRIEVRGLKGGDAASGIACQRANAIKLLFRFLYLAMKNFDLNIGYVEGGSQTLNEIPREATAVICGPGTRKEDIIYGLEEYEKIIREEYRGIDDDISIRAYECEVPDSIWDRKTMERVIGAVCGCPGGVIKMSPDRSGAVETSANLGMVRSEHGEITLRSLIRSDMLSECDALANDITAVFELAGALVRFEKVDNGARSMTGPRISQLVKHTYKELFGVEAEVRGIYAGLESDFPDSLASRPDTVAFGPTLTQTRSLEKIDIESVSKFWKLLCATLSAIPGR